MLRIWVSTRESHNQTPKEKANPLPLVPRLWFPAVSKPRSRVDPVHEERGVCKQYFFISFDVNGVTTSCFRRCSGIVVSRAL